MKPHPTSDREAEARDEIGLTEVARPVSRFLTGLFLLTILLVPSLEVARDMRKSASPWSDLARAPARAWQAGKLRGPLEGNRLLLGDMTAFEDALNERSLVAERARADFQWILTRHLKAGNEQVVVGRQGWLYFRPALDYVMGRGFLDSNGSKNEAGGKGGSETGSEANPLDALADFAAQLSGRGIALVVVPIPVKASIHSEGLTRDLEGNPTVENPSFTAFLERLADLEIPAYSPREILVAARRAKTSPSWPQFLKTDSHWTPQGMEHVASGLAEYLVQHVPLPERDALALSRREEWVEGRGDLAALLRLPLRSPLYRPEPVLTRQVMDASGAPLRPDPNADVLVLGDSFTNIYSQPELGWGESAGFAEQLSYFLRRPVDKVAINAGGPKAAREALASAYASGRDRLAGKRVVIYAFSARELSSGDWRLVDLAPTPASPLKKEVQAERARRPTDPLPARGFIAWESNRGGDWRIWTRRLEGSPAQMLSPNEPGVQHCCAHISPDGKRLVYLSRAVPVDQYPELEVAGELRLVNLKGRKARLLVPDARPYGWGNRAVVWRTDSELVYIDGAGRTRLLDVDTGASSTLSDEPQGTLAWLFNASLGHAVRGSPNFSPYDAAARHIAEAPKLRGCEPYFSHDGRFGFWVEGAGGPIQSIELQTGRTSTILAHKDPRIPGVQRYAYFPMVSRDSRMLAFGASPGDHDHFRSNYDIFVAPVDPRSLQLVGRPMRMTSNSRSDRYPDVHVETLDLVRWKKDAPPIPLPLRGVAPSPRPPSAGGPLTVRAELQVCSRPPTLKEISPYREALIVCEWSVSEVLQGDSESAPPGTRLRVTHWALRDGARLPITFATPGYRADLHLEPVNRSAQFEGYPVFDSLKPAPELAVRYAREPGKVQ